MATYFNTAFSLAMVSAPCSLRVVELPAASAAEMLGDDFNNVANPSHSNTLAAVSQRLGVDVRQAAGGRVALGAGDQCLVAQVTFPPAVPRETKEYTDEQIALGKFSFILVTVS